MPLRKTAARGPVLAWREAAAAIKRKLASIPAWTSLVRKRKIWHGLLGQQCCPNSGGHGVGLKLSGQTSVAPKGSGRRLERQGKRPGEKPDLAALLEIGYAQAAKLMAF
jgi:hypothetical protein